MDFKDIKAILILIIWVYFVYKIGRDHLSSVLLRIILDYVVVENYRHVVVVEEANEENIVKELMNVIVELLEVLRG